MTVNPILLWSTAPQDLGDENKQIPLLHKTDEPLEFSANYSEILITFFF